MVTLTNKVDLFLFNELKDEKGKDKVLFNILNYKIKTKKINLKSNEDLLIENHKEFNEKYKEYHYLADNYYFFNNCEVFDTVKNVEESYL